MFFQRVHRDIFSLEEKDLPVRCIEVKRWISNADRVETVILKNGYKYQFSRKEMLRAYFDYLMELARQQYCVSRSMM